MHLMNGITTVRVLRGASVMKFATLPLASSESFQASTPLDFPAVRDILRETATCSLAQKINSAIPMAPVAASVVSA